MLENRENCDDNAAAPDEHTQPKEPPPEALDDVTYRPIGFSDLAEAAEASRGEGASSRAGFGTADDSSRALDSLRDVGSSARDGLSSTVGASSRGALISPREGAPGAGASESGQTLAASARASVHAEAAEDGTSRAYSTLANVGTLEPPPPPAAAATVPRQRGVRLADPQQQTAADVASPHGGAYPVYTPPPPASRGRASRAAAYLGGGSRGGGAGVGGTGSECGGGRPSTQRSMMSSIGHAVGAALTRRLPGHTDIGHTESHEIWLEIDSLSGIPGLPPRRQAQSKGMHAHPGQRLSDGEKRAELERLSSLRRAKMNRAGVGGSVGGSGAGGYGGGAGGGATSDRERSTKKKSSVGAVETGFVYALVCPEGKKYVGKTQRTLTQRQNTQPVTGTRLIRASRARPEPPVEARGGRGCSLSLSLPLNC